MGGDRKARGALGENVAAEWLIEHGYEILERNWRVKGGELDIIAAKEEILAFVEVKLRASDSLAPPLGSVLRAQRQRIVKTAIRYMQQRGIYETGEFQPRFDIFEVETRPGCSDVVLRCGLVPGAYDMGGLDVFL